MATFANPFAGNVDRKLTDDELIQALREDLAGELEAIYLYDAHVHATDNAAAKAVLSDIRDEERAHVGELMTLLRTLDPEEMTLFASGEGEVQEMLSDLGIVSASETSATELSDSPATSIEAEGVGRPTPKASVPSVGSLLDR